MDQHHSLGAHPINMFCSGVPKGERCCGHCCMPCPKKYSVPPTTTPVCHIPSICTLRTYEMVKAINACKTYMQKIHQSTNNTGMLCVRRISNMGVRHWKDMHSTACPKGLSTCLPISASDKDFARPDDRSYTFNSTGLAIEASFAACPNLFCTTLDVNWRGVSNTQNGHDNQ